MTSSISIYNFNQNPIRTTTVDGEPYFCLVDACGALGLSNSRKTKTQLSEGGVIKSYTPTKSGTQEVTFINEPNLYRLIFRSNKPQAQAFADWVYSEVLPSIRKTGGYGAPAVDMKAIGGLVKKCCAVAVRQEIADILDKIVASGDSYKAVYPTSDNDLILCLYNWYATHHQKTFDAMREITAENEKLKRKLLDIKKAVN